MYSIYGNIEISLAPGTTDRITNWENNEYKSA